VSRAKLSGMFALLLSTIVAQAGAPAYLSSCAPPQQIRVLATSQVIVGDNIHPTNRRTRFFIDIGSDGRVRHVIMYESSGDATFDQAAVEAAERFRFAPPTQGCISTSAIVPEEFNVPLLSFNRPAPVGSAQPALPTPPPEAAAICTDSAVEVAGLDVPDTHQAPGTAAIDVALDANAHVKTAKLAKSSGNAKTDATAVDEAKSAQYKFDVGPGCRPKPTTYQLELTFH
jgi:TonB family protein